MRLRRRPEPIAPPAPDRTHLHLEQIQAVADRYACDHAPCIARRDQAAAHMAMPFGAGVVLAQHVVALARRTPALPEEVVR